MIQNKKEQLKTNKRASKTIMTPDKLSLYRVFKK